MHKITKQEFEYYKNTTKFFIKELNLENWEISIELDTEDIENRAWCATQDSDRIALIRLIEKWDYLPKKEELALIAFHEVCELLLAEIHNKLSCIFNKNETSRVVHTVIRTLENVLFPFLYKKYKRKK
jgi:hypothetical protein